MPQDHPVLRGYMNLQTCRHLKVSQLPRSKPAPRGVSPRSWPHPLQERNAGKVESAGADESSSTLKEKTVIPEEEHIQTTESWSLKGWGGWGADVSVTACVNWNVVTALLQFILAAEAKLCLLLNDVSQVRKKRAIAAETGINVATGNKSMGSFFCRTSVGASPSLSSELLSWYSDEMMVKTDLCVSSLDVLAC